MTWMVRSRDSNLILGDFVNFKSLTLYENYLSPDRLQITGRLEDLYPIMGLGNGVYVRDDRGRVRFSGWLNTVNRVGTGDASVVFDGDYVLLNDRETWSVPAVAWSEQPVTKFDTQTGSSEDRILGYINRNAGPAAYHAGYGSTDAVTNAQFQSYLTLTPKDRNLGAQGMSVDDVTGDIYVTQAAAVDEPKTNDTLIISRYANGKYKSHMSLPGGGHGVHIEVDRTGTTVFLTILFGQHTTKLNSGTWVRIPYIPGKTWRLKRKLKHPAKATAKKNVTEALKYASGAVKTSVLKQTPWLQGETFYAGNFYRLYGVPYKESGPTADHEPMPGRIEVIKDGKIVRVIDASSLGRDAAGKPLGGRLEPEGLDIIMVNGVPNLLAGVNINTHGNYELKTYTYPLQASASVFDDRRVDHLRLPATFGRGVSAQTMSFKDNLGDLVAQIAETGDLRVQVVQRYEGFTPFLDVVVSDAPDFSAWARFGGLENPGPGMLNEAWSATTTAPSANVILSAAGSDTAPKLTRYINTDSQLLWKRRIEATLDQGGNTNDDDITSGLLKAAADAAGSSEVTAPLNDVKMLGDEIPVGAKVTVIIDGLYLISRIRRIATHLDSTDGSGATIRVTPTFGDPSTPLKLSDRALRSLYSRVKNLEKK